MWAQGILSSLDPEPDPLAYTASYTCLELSNTPTEPTESSVFWVLKTDRKTDRTSL
jgi:hypothetical protein